VRRISRQHAIDRRPADLEGLRELRDAFALRLQHLEFREHLDGIAIWKTPYRK
jgi:hypothetical protein